MISLFHFATIALLKITRYFIGNKVELKKLNPKKIKMMEFFFLEPLNHQLKNHYWITLKCKNEKYLGHTLVLSK